MNENYSHVGKPLTERIASALIIEIFSGKTGIEKKEIRRVVDETHTQRGGHLSTNEVHPVSSALSALKRQGLADNPTRGVWSIFSSPGVHPNNPVNSEAVRTLGKGKNAVYLCYYPVYRSLAECEGKEFWACKISSIPPQVCPDIPEPPEIGLIFKTDDPENLEQILHNILKLRGKQIADAPGNAWFLTSPTEAEGIYKNVIGGA